MIKGLSTKLSIEDYNVFLILTKLEYQVGLIKEEEGTSELLRFTIRHILNQLRNDQIYHYLEQQQEQQKKVQNNQQRPYDQVILLFPTTTTIIWKPLGIAVIAVIAYINIQIDKHIVVSPYTNSRDMI
jgi:hypothetical protein